MSSLNAKKMCLRTDIPKWKWESSLPTDHTPSRSGALEGAERKACLCRQISPEAKGRDRWWGQHTLTSDPDINQSPHVKTFRAAPCLHCGSTDLFWRYNENKLWQATANIQVFLVSLSVTHTLKLGMSQFWEFFELCHRDSDFAWHNAALFLITHIPEFKTKEFYQRGSCFPSAPLWSNVLTAHLSQVTFTNI